MMSLRTPLFALQLRSNLFTESLQMAACRAGTREYCLSAKHLRNPRSRKSQLPGQLGAVLHGAVCQQALPLGGDSSGARAVRSLISRWTR